MERAEGTALELGRRIAAGECSVMEAADTVLAQIERTEGEYHCYVTLQERRALERRAGQVQEGIRAGAYKTSVLAGVPVALKDNLCTAGLRTTCASRMLERFVPTYTATAAERLAAAGAVVIGKTNLDEFAMGNTTETSAFGATKNPRNPAHVPGGSSGGSAAAVAAGECAFALGSDTGGSIRQPAAFCGVVGLKPTYGAVSRFGLVAYASSLEQVGPITRDVADCAAVFDCIVGRDAKDSTSVPWERGSTSEGLTEGVGGMRIGVPKDWFGEGTDREVKESVLAAAKLLRGQGAVVEEFELGLMRYVVPAYYTIASAEASSNLARFDGVKYGYRAKGCGDLQRLYRDSRSEGFGEEVRRRILLGSYVLSSGYYEAYYLKALRVRTLIRQAFDEALGRYDLLLLPTAPTTAPRLEEGLRDPLSGYLGDIDTVCANLAGLPAISVPCGEDSSGLPIGLQLIGGRFEERTLLRAAYVVEQETKGRKGARQDEAV